MEVWDWELYTIKGKRKKVDQMDHRQRKREQVLVDVEEIMEGTKPVFLRGSVKSKHDGTFEIRSFSQRAISLPFT